MQFMRSTTTAAICLLLGGATCYSKQDRRNDRPDDQRGGRQQRPEKQPQVVRQREPNRGRADAPRERAIPQQQRVERREVPKREQPRVQEPRAPHRERDRAVAVDWQQRRGWMAPGAWQGRNSWNEGRAKHWEREHRTWVERGGYGGYYIPQSHFALHFGSLHRFRIASRPVIYMGYPRFTYAGFSFLLVDPWPEFWHERWYETDDVYIDYDDGYYLYNPRHPGVRLAVTVAL